MEAEVNYLVPIKYNSIEERVKRVQDFGPKVEKAGLLSDSRSVDPRYPERFLPMESICAEIKR